MHASAPATKQHAIRFTTTESTMTHPQGVGFRSSTFVITVSSVEFILGALFAALGRRVFGIRTFWIAALSRVHMMRAGHELVRLRERRVQSRGNTKRLQNKSTGRAGEQKSRLETEKKKRRLTEADSRGTFSQRQKLQALDAHIDPLRTADTANGEVGASHPHPLVATCNCNWIRNVKRGTPFLDGMSK